jgi:predicted  nucleic acid-binding Zn-ribbon protein
MDMDFEKTMQFMLEMQAKHEVWLQKHEEAMKKHEEAMMTHEQAITRIDAAIEAGAARAAQLESSVATVTDLVGRVAQAETRLAERMESGFRDLREVQAASEYKLNALIETVDKLVRRNGHDQSTK